MKIFAFLLFAIILFSCGSKEKQHETAKQPDLRQQIRELQAKTKTGKESKTDLLELIRLYKMYADSFPNDKLAPVGLVSAADCYGRLKMQQEKCNLYKSVIDKYPDFNDADMVLYLYASALDSDINNRVEAKKYYELYVQKFPNSIYIPDAKSRLTTIDSLSFKELGEMIIHQELEQSK